MYHSIEYNYKRNFFNTLPIEIMRLRKQALADGRKSVNEKPI